MIRPDPTSTRPHWLMLLFVALSLGWLVLAVGAPSPDMETMALVNAAGSAFLALVSWRRRVPGMSDSAHAWMLRYRAPLAIGLLVVPTAVVMLGVPPTVGLASVWAVLIATVVVID